MDQNSEIKLLRNKDLLVFGEDFARHPHSLEHLLRPLFPFNRLIWIETIGLRSPRLSFYDFKKIFLKILRWLSSEKKVSQISKKPDSIDIVSPFMIPYNQFFLIRKVNQFCVLRAVRKKIKELNFKCDLTITSVPCSCDYVGFFNEKKIIYVCVDEFSLWPGLSFKMVHSMEQKLLLKSDLVLATSTNLQISKTNHKTQTLLLTHGVDFEHFHLPYKKINSEKTQICYFGLFDERSNQEIISYIAEHVDHCEIHIIGDVVCDISVLKKNKKIRFRGPVKYMDLPREISEMDLFILPYAINEMTKNLNPLKLKEYICTGRPVISTSIPEVLKLKQYVLIADSGAEFKKCIDELRANRVKLSPDQALKYLTDSQTWTMKASEFSEAILNI